MCDGIKRVVTASNPLHKAPIRIRPLLDEFWQIIDIAIFTSTASTTPCARASQPSIDSCTTKFNW